MNRSTKIISIIIIIIIMAFWTFLQHVFSMVNNLDKTSSEINTIVAIEWCLLTLFVSYLIYVGYVKKIVVTYFSFLIANIFFMIATSIKTPIFLRNVGFHHSDYIPTLNPLLINSFVFISFLVYINFRFRQKKVTSKMFSKLVYVYSIIAVLTIIYVKISSKPEIEKILNFSG